MAGNRPIPTKPSSSAPLDFASSLAASFLSASPLAQEVLARDLAECSDDGDNATEALEDASESDTDSLGPTLYRRPSGIAYGTARPALGPRGFEEPVLTRVERKESRNAELSLLRDNHILPPKHPAPQRQTVFRQLYKKLFSTKVPRPVDDEEDPQIIVSPSETSPLLEGSSSGGQHLNEQWEAAVAAGQIKTTWQREAKTIAVYSRSLVVTFFLQYSINIASIFAVGHIGKEELGAISCKSTYSMQMRSLAPVLC